MGNVEYDFWDMWAEASIYCFTKLANESTDPKVKEKYMEMVKGWEEDLKRYRDNKVRTVATPDKVRAGAGPGKPGGQ